MMTCKYCRSDKLVKRRNGPHIGIYCATCGKWQQWVKEGTPKEREVPWQSGGYAPKCVIIDDAVDAVDYAKQLPPGVAKILKHSYFGVSAMSEEEFKATIEARFPTKAKITEAHSDPDDKPPWED